MRVFSVHFAILGLHRILQGSVCGQLSLVTRDKRSLFFFEKIRRTTDAPARQHAVHAAGQELGYDFLSSFGGPLLTLPKFDSIE